MEEEEEPETLSRRVVLAQLDKAGRDLANYVSVACSAHVHVLMSFQSLSLELLKGFILVGLLFYAGPDPRFRPEHVVISSGNQDVSAVQIGRAHV